MRIEILFHAHGKRIFRINKKTSDELFEVFRLIGKGLQPREIAEKLCLSTKTVETHRMNIRKKFGMANASEVIQYAIEWSQMTYRATE